MCDSSRGYGPSLYVALYVVAAHSIPGEDSPFMPKVVGAWAMPNPIVEPDAVVTGQDVSEHAPDGVEKFYVIPFCLN